MKKANRKIMYKIAILTVGMLLMTACGNEAKTVDNSTMTETLESQADSEGETEETVATSQTGHETESSNKTESDSVAESEEAVFYSQTMETFLRTALLPVGNTMYIWGGGWNAEDTGAGPGATTIGVSPTWNEFALLQDANYNYKDHKYEILNGLDCSGYVGWAVYNLFETEEGKDGYVFKSTETAEKYSSFGWGELIENPEEFLPGDIVSMKGHVWISLGMCEDGSVVLVHASPPGVSICGTPLEGGESMAVGLAKAYMSKYYPHWQETYPDREVGKKYVSEVTVMRWNENTLPDAEEIQGLSAEEVLKLLFEE